MDHARIMGFLVLLWTTQFALQFAEARVLDHNSAATLSSDLDAVAVDSSTGGRGHVTNYSESNRGSNYGNSTHAANNTIITVELLQKEATPGDGRRSQAPAGIEEVATIEGNADTLHQVLKSHSSHTSVNDGIQGNILSSSGHSPGVGHWQKSKSKDSTSPASNVLSSGPCPGAGNAHTSAVGTTQSESNAFNKLPSGPSPGVGHKVSNSYTEKAQAVSITQESELKKKMTTMNNILPSGPSPGVGNSATNGRNLMENGAKDEEIMGIQTFPASNVLPSDPSPGVRWKGHTSAVGGTQSELGTFNKLPTGSSPGVGHKVTNGYTEIAQESEAKERGIMNKLPSGPSPGVGNSATNGRNTMEKTISTEEDEEGLMGIQTFNRLPSGPSPGVGHSYTNNHVTANVKIASASEDGKGSEDAVPIFHKLPGGPSPGGGHSSTVKMQLSSMAPMKTSSRPSLGDGNLSKNKSKPVGGSQKEKVEQTAGALDRKIGCDGGGLEFYGTPTPPMFGIAAAGS